MIHPTPSELLARIADALTDTVLPELEAIEARIQLQVAALILRRLAGPAGDVGPYLDADARDIAGTVDGWLTRVTMPDPGRAREVVDAALAADPVPTTAELVERYEAVQGVLVAVERALGELPPEDADRVAIDAELRALLARMLTRESAIHTTYAAW